MRKNGESQAGDGGRVGFIYWVRSCCGECGIAAVSTRPCAGMRVIEALPVHRTQP